MIANLNNVDHKIYKIIKNGYTLYSKLKYTTNTNLSPYCVGDIVSYSSDKCLVFSDSMEKDSILVIYTRNNMSYIKNIRKSFISGILKQSDLNTSESLSIININKSKNSILRLYNKSGSQFFGNIGDEYELEYPIYEFSYKKIKEKLKKKIPDIIKDIPEEYIIHGIIDYTVYHFHTPYKNEFFTQYNPYWNQLYHGVHILWDYSNKDLDIIKPDKHKSYSKVKVGDIFIDSEGIIYIAAIFNEKLGFYSFKDFQFFTEKYYKNKAIELYAIDDRLNVIPLISLLWNYGLSLGVKLDI